MADNRRTQTKAAIKRASAAARAGANRLDRQALDELTEIYRNATHQLRDIVGSYADREGTLRLEVMRDLLAQSEQQLDHLSRARNSLLDQKMGETANLATRPFAPVSHELNTSLTRVASDAVEHVKRFIDKDGLQLSDRLWRLDQHAKRVIGDQIQTSIIMGHSGSQAAREFLARGERVPGDIAQKIQMANADRVGKSIRQQLMAAESTPYKNALRVFRTEINRAHIESYRNAAMSHPDAVGTRFLLSPNHPEVDICDLHAQANLYGLGPGVYPFGKSPLPAHPNTLSYEAIVWRDEITDEDRAGKISRIEWLQKQSPDIQAQILGMRKSWALREGLLTENMINTPWAVLKTRFEKGGVEIPTFGRQ